MCKSLPEKQLRKVRTHSGYRADEHPSEFVQNGYRYCVIEVLERQRVQSISGLIREEFLVLTDLKEKFRLVHHLDDDTWWMRSVR